MSNSGDELNGAKWARSRQFHSILTHATYMNDNQLTDQSVTICICVREINKQHRIAMDRVCGPTLVWVSTDRDMI